MSGDAGGRGEGPNGEGPNGEGPNGEGPNGEGRNGGRDGGGRDGGGRDGGVALVGVLVGFGRALRGAGLPVGSGDLLGYAAAAAVLDPTDLTDLYWAGRVCLVRRREDIAPYDEVFRQYFLDHRGPARDLPRLRAQAHVQVHADLEVPAAEPAGEERRDETALGLLASAAEVLRRKSFAACTQEELAALRRIMTRIRLTPPRRRTRRTAAATTGPRPDLRRTVRASLRTHGEPVRLYWRRRRVRVRPLVFILDVSGSMADYSRALLQFAHSARRASGRVEVFCFGTRLTRITSALRARSPDEALAAAAALVVDWDGGTRIGASVDAFVRGWGRRGMSRGAVVLICSDGLDRGDPELLATAMHRLARLCHRIVWINPHAGSGADPRPQPLGMIVARPHIDVLLPGDDLSSLERLAERLPRLG